MARVDRDRRYISWKGMVLASVLLVALFCVSLYWVKADIAKLQAQDATLQLKVNVMEMNYADLQLELQRDASAALSTLETAIGIIRAPEDAALLMFRAAQLCEKSLHDTEAAQSWLQRAVDSHPDTVYGRRAAARLM